MSLSFLTDAQLPPGLAELFTRAGHEAVHVADVGLHMEDDAKISAYASKAGMVLVTKDQDFATMRRLSPAAPRVMGQNRQYDESCAVGTDTASHG